MEVRRSSKLPPKAVDAGWSSPDLHAKQPPVTIRTPATYNPQFNNFKTSAEPLRLSIELSSLHLIHPEPYQRQPRRRSAYGVSMIPPPMIQILRRSTLPALHLLTRSVMPQSPRSLPRLRRRSVLRGEWERETRKDAFRTARHSHALDRTQRHKDQNQAHLEDAKRRAALYQKQVEEVQAVLATLGLQRKKEEDVLKAQWQERDRKLRERVDAAIKLDEEKLNAKLELERQQKEKEEQLRKELEARKREAEERKRQEEEERRLQLEKEEEARRKQEEAERLRVEREAAEVQARKALGVTTAFEDWCTARDYLKTLKNGSMRIVKSDKELKAIWSAGRRAITPKIGQLTNDPEAINRICQQIVEIIRPPKRHPVSVYLALLSSLAKAILLQAETEVTAEKRAAFPLAAVAAYMMPTLEHFAKVFWAKLCQRAGGWPIPIAIPDKDFDGKPFEQGHRMKAMGFRPDEPAADYMTRVAGVMRVYFQLLGSPTDTPLSGAFQLPRAWTYFVRMLAEPQLLESAVAPQIMYTALDVFGAEARSIWGHQLIGGESPEGIAARVRLQLEIERIMNTNF
ncbi:Nucleoporin gle1 [Grifola frondosa]|uniref:mRNA export factor GLE1 n=1 Tax=Grifola frondosa TaxID=5627 RepID=A0A1C7MKV0_GRIFR|nr:Nucleoporin gle1 [Grifola frondosa]